jgi:hypothetical protein
MLITECTFVLSKAIHLVSLSDNPTEPKQQYLPYLKKRTMKTLYPAFSLHRFSKSVLSLLMMCLGLLPHAGNAQLKFSDLSHIGGTDKEVGASYRAKAVFPGIDAIVYIDSLVNGASIVDMDQEGYGYKEAFQPRIQSGGNGVSYAVFRFQFVLENTSIPYVLGSLTATNLDLDGNNHLKEFCEFNLGGGLATFMSNTPEISVSAKAGGMFYAENVSGVEYTGIDTSADAVMFKVKKNALTGLTVRLGATVSNNSQAARQYSVYFKDFEISNPASLPLTLLNFNAFLKDDNVNLSWATTEHKDFSHFVAQRSTDSKMFKNIMTMMTEETVSSSINQYGYTDNVSGVNSTIIYYRLQMVDIDGSYTYSPVRMVRMNADNKVEVKTFPNPVTTELRVSIPAGWQEKATTYEIYNTNGALISRTQVARAAQVQQLNVQSLGSGNYIIRVKNGQEMSSSKFIKN